MALRNLNAQQVTQRVGVLRNRLEHQHQLMQSLDAWRHLEIDDLEDEIWREVPESTKRWTIAVPHIAATTDTVVAFLSGRAPRFTTTPRNSTRLTAADRANVNERLGKALFDTVDQQRATSLLSDSAEYVVHRGVLVYKALWLSPEERGEERETVTPELDLPDVEGAEDALVVEQVIAEGDFPLLVQVIDPLDCYWTLGKDDRVIEFAHEWQSTWDVLVDLFPDLPTHGEFRAMLASGERQLSGATVTVIDYWNEEFNVILIDGKPYKQAQHGYGETPVVVELAKPKMPRRKGQQGIKEGTPFCAPMLNAVRQFSRADSMSASYLEEAAIAVLVHEGIDPNGNSPYFVVAEGEAEPQYRAVIDLGPEARIMPLFGNERLKYMDPPRIVDVLQEFKAARQRDAALVSFPESILSGAQTADVSGYAYSQMKQAAMARVAPYRMALDRGLSRLMNLANRIIARNWDFLADDPITLQLVTGQRGDDIQQVEVTLDDFQNAGIVKVEVQPEVPVNQEQEWGMMIQLNTSGLLSQYNAIDRIGLVQDPSEELKRIAFEREALENPQIRASLAFQYARENDVPIVQPNQPPGAPPEGGMPPDMGPLPVASSEPTPGLPAPVSGGMPPSGGALPPDLLAALTAPGG